MCWGAEFGGSLVPPYSLSQLEQLNLEVGVASLYGPDIRNPAVFECTLGETCSVQLLGLGLGPSSGIAVRRDCDNVTSVTVEWVRT